MNTIAFNNSEKTKKLIELPNEVCRHLAVQAAAMGMSVKKLMENMIIRSVEEADDDAIYNYLCKTQPDGGVLMSEDEQSHLIASLRKKAISDEI